ncbi:MAG: threonine--tRNA ligase, partial [Candidatus Pacearchaeota archaeon]|nr:threonine--tRNA ligase [Candidatus Pacearchaeota archaeon]
MNIEYIRHSFAHLLAAAVLKLRPEAKLGMGPVIENGFYYDFEGVEISEKDVKTIEQEMRSLASQHLAFKKELWDKAKAKRFFKDQPFKLELISYLPPGKVGIVHTGKAFSDLCRGGHVKNTNELPLKAFSLTRVAGAYWKGDEKRPQLTRVYGVAFASKEEHSAYLAQMKEAELRDHRRLGRELGLFAFSDLVGPGLPLFTPKGTRIFRELQKFSERLKEDIGFHEVHIPHIAKKDLYRVSGHLEKFGEDIFTVKGKDSEFVLKPMNCPHHIQIYASRPRSYRELPFNIYETTTVYRDERAGELAGLTRVRSITQDDSHAFLAPEQTEELFERILKQIQKFVKAFQLTEYRIRLSLRDEKNPSSYLGDKATWKKAQTEMERILKRNKIPYVRAEGEAAFYGPKMDFLAKDSLGREVQISTIQLDLNLPERFSLTYTGAKGEELRPVMIHSAFLGSIERFLGVLIEHFAGAFPLWLSPEQVWILSVSAKFNSLAAKTAQELSALVPGIRVSVRENDETLGKKIREGEVQKIPYLLILGSEEKKAKTVSVRKRGKGDLGTMKLEV